MIKLILTDMDGTLLNRKGEISQEFWRLAEEFQEKKVIFGVASGRPYYNLSKKFEKWKGEIVYLADNGACVMYDGQCLFADYMTKSDVKKILEKSIKIPEVAVILCGKDRAYIEKEVYTSGEFKSEIDKYYNELVLVDDICSVDDEILKISICDFKGTEKHSFPYLEELQKEFIVQISGQVWLDMMTLGTNKGRAVEKIQEKLGINYEETMIFGDYLNDYEMMSKGKYSYAMKNAHEKLKEVSNYVTKYDNNDDGVLKTIREYFPQKLNIKK